MVWDLGNVILLCTYPPESEQIRICFPFTPEQLPCAAAWASVKVRVAGRRLPELPHAAEGAGWQQGEGLQKAAREGNVLLFHCS